MRRPLELVRLTNHVTWQPCEGWITEHRIRPHVDNIIEAYGTIEPQGSIVGGQVASVCPTIVNHVLVRV